MQLSDNFWLTKLSQDGWLIDIAHGMSKILQDLQHEPSRSKFLQNATYIISYLVSTSPAH